MTDRRATTRAIPTALIGVLLLAAYLGLSLLSDGMLWYDEWWSYWSAGAGQYGPLPFSAVIDHALGEPSQPPLFYLILWAWNGLAGGSPFAVRFVPFAFGLLTVAWTARLGTDISGDRRVGVLAALLLTTSALFVDYLHELRLYTMMTLFSAMSVATYWRVYRAERSGTLPVILFVLAVAGAFYAHLLTLLTLSAIGVYHLFFVPRDRRWWQVSGLAMLGAAFILPWIGVTLGAVEAFTTAGGRTDTAMSAADVLVHLAYAFVNGAWIIGVQEVILGVIGSDIPRDSRRGAAFVAGLAVAILAQALILNALAGVVTHARYLLSLWPLGMILLALASVSVLRLGRIGLNVVTLFVVIWAFFGFILAHSDDFYAVLFRDVHTNFFRPDLPLDDFGEIVQEQAVAGDVVVLQAVQSPWAVSGSFSLAVHGTPARYAVWEELDDPAAFIADAGRVWLAVDETFGRPEALPLPNFAPCETVLDTRRMDATLYAKNPILCGTPQGELGAGVTFLDAALVPEDDGASVTATLTWHTAGIPADTYSVGLYVFDSDGAFVAQGRDVPLPLGDFNYAITSIDTHDLPPGAYTVTTAVYFWQTGERIPLHSSETDVAIGGFSLAEDGG